MPASRSTLPALLVAVAVAACGGDAAPPASGPPGPVEVGVVTVEPRDVTLSRELPGRISAFRVAEVRARVNGIVLKRLFEEGSDVAEGAPLFKIDPAPYQAALDSARAQLARAEAAAELAKSLAERYAKLVETRAVSRQEYEDAVARSKTATADVAAARAQIRTAQINVDYTTVKAPISGRIGRAEVTEGAYVQQSAATLLATVQQLDRMYVDLTWSSAEMLRIRRALEAGELEGGEAKVTLILEDGRDHPVPGTLQFADVTVDETTGSVQLRAVVPNADSRLLPGMFVRARIDEGKRAGALLVPQRAVSRDQTGRPIALVVGQDGKVERRQLATDRAVGDAWLVTQGIAAGDRVIVEGLQKVRPGAEVVAVPAKATAAAPPARGP
jgi:membrane fusion protein, multidrug efflux system